MKIGLIVQNKPIKIKIDPSGQNEPILTFYLKWEIPEKVIVRIAFRPENPAVIITTFLFFVYFLCLVSVVHHE